VIGCVTVAGVVFVGTVVVGATVGVTVVAAALGVAAGVTVAAEGDALAAAEGDALADADAEALGEGLVTAVLVLEALWLRWASVSCRASTATPPAPTVANAASPAVIAVTRRRPLWRMFMTAASKGRLSGACARGQSRLWASCGC
jgi:hypothetical protein